MINSTTIQIDKITDFDNNYIENELFKKFNSVVRWALIDIDDNSLTLSVSYQS